MTEVFESYSTEDTFEYAKKLGKNAKPGQVYTDSSSFTVVGDLLV